MSNRKLYLLPKPKRTWNTTPPPSLRDQREEHARYLVMRHAEAGTIPGMDVLKLRHANTRWTAILAAMADTGAAKVAQHNRGEIISGRPT
jgi:hypothetical protein